MLIKPTKITRVDNGISINGRLVYSSVSDLMPKINECLRAHVSTSGEGFYVDCEQVKRIDSAGIALFLDLQKQCKQLKTELKFTGFSVQAKSLIQAYSLESVIYS